MKERTCSHRSKFFPLRVDSFLGRLRPHGKQTSSSRSANRKSQKLSPFENMAEKDGGVPIVVNTVNNVGLFLLFYIAMPSL